MTPWHHALSSVQKWGGIPEDYMPLHNWFDQTKSLTGNWTHRALRHHAAGIQEAVGLFGDFLTITDKNGESKRIALRPVAEQHVIEDCGFIPTVQDWLTPLKEHPHDWMLKVKTKTTTALFLTP